MKKTRLLEIVREEISFALREGEAEEKMAKMAQLKATDLEIKALQKKKAEMMKTGVAENQLNEIEQLAEMASIVQLKTQLEKQGKNKELSAVKAAEKVTIDKLKQNPVFTGDGKDARLKGYVSALKKELKAEHNIDLQKLLTAVMVDAEAAGDKFNDDIATNTIEKNAAAQVLGTEKSTPGPKPNPNKPEKAPSTGQRGRPAGAAKEKVATRTPGDDGFDDVSYSDVEDEEGPSAKDIAGDKTAKELAQASPASKDENFDRIRTGLMNKAKKAKGELSAEDKKLASQIINTAKTKYKFNATQVDALRAVAGL